MTTATSTRPFGLTRTVTLDDATAVNPLDGLRYDPALQLNVNEAGVPVVKTTAASAMVTHQNTQHDSQWFTDKD